MATKEKVYTGKCYYRDEEGLLYVALSYEEGGQTKTDDFRADEETGEIIQ